VHVFACGGDVSDDVPLELWSVSEGSVILTLVQHSNGFSVAPSAHNEGSMRDLSHRESKFVLQEPFSVLLACSCPLVISTSGKLIDLQNVTSILVLIRFFVVSSL